MKKNKVIGTIAISMMLGLSGCNLLISQQCDHEWEPWEIVEDPTCVDRGYKVRSCMLCGKEQSRSIRIDTINGHHFIPDLDSDRAATCTEDGITGSEICFYCNMKKAGTKTGKGEHKLQRAADQSAAKYKDATCTEDGLEAMECRVCHDIIDQKIPAKGHHEAATLEATAKEGIKILKCDREGCGKIMAYELDIKNADAGWKTVASKMNGTGDTNGKTTWNLAGIIPEGSYNVELEAAMTSSSHDGRRLYNMARLDLAIGNDSSNVGTDTVNDDPYRYFVKVDGVDYNPTTKKTYSELGLQAAGNNPTESNIPFQFVDFIEGLQINKDTGSVTLCHSNLGYSLFVRSIRLIPHEHEMKTKTVNVSGKTAYTYKQCDCGYRNMAFEALAGTFGNGQTNDNTIVDSLKLKNVNDSITYKFNVDEDITGNLYVNARAAVANLAETPYDSYKVEVNGVEVTTSETATVQTLLGGEDASKAGYTKEGRVLLRNVTFQTGSENTLKITRTGNHDLYISDFEFVGRPTHLHHFLETGVKEADCTSDKIVTNTCACGKVVRETIEGTKKDHTWIHDPEKTDTPAECDMPGMAFYKCSVCGTTKREILPAAHDFSVDATPEGNSYSITECSHGDAKMYSWTMAEAKPGATLITSPSDQNLGVYKLGANDTITLEFNSSVAKTGKLRFYATTKAGNVASCQMYRQTIAENSPQVKYSVNVNGSSTDVVYPDSVLDKTIEELGVTGVESDITADGSKLAVPQWFDYCDVQIQSGNNTIVIKKPNTAGYSAYFAGFAVVV